MSCRSQKQFVLHGDLHHGNIIKTIDGQYKLIDPKPLVGDLAYETSNLFYNGLDQTFSSLLHILKSRADTLSEILNLDQRRVFQYALLHGYKRLVWFKQDGLKDEKTSTVIEILHGFLR